ncbi:hypothetical protein PILCRDRAFT_824920 [Piloderma croceum F 1598]|uniref:F-box domain-containing protein n=1 Tax=Piloderma croceum (strain F 1598) TaxID=765440 RepID=A0A0C3FDH7_PILCF|nr:hypothetical protein PILCRDRAFT_824920 [Piloderma croceum F 1598]
MSPFANLPPELVQHIFSLASAASRNSGLNICLVASWARHIALPHLLHTVVIKDHLANAQFRHNLQGQSPYDPSPGFLAPPLIYNVWMEAVSDRIISLFNACDNIQHLALADEAFLWLIHASSPIATVGAFNSTISQSAVARPQDLHLTIISAGRRWTHPEYMYGDVTMRSPLLSKITRIYLADMDVLPTFSEIEIFTRLTHLAVPFYDWFDHGKFLRTLLLVELLEMLVVVIITGDVVKDDRAQIESQVAEIRKTDGRIYLAESLYRGVGIQKQWEEEMRGGKSIWDKAVRYTSEYEARKLRHF